MVPTPTKILVSPLARRGAPMPSYSSLELIDDLATQILVTDRTPLLIAKIIRNADPPAVRPRFTHAPSITLGAKALQAGDVLVPPAGDSVLTVSARGISRAPRSIIVACLVARIDLTKLARNVAVYVAAWATLSLFTASQLVLTYTATGGPALAQRRFAGRRYSGFALASADTVCSRPRTRDSSTRREAIAQRRAGSSSLR